MTRRTPGGSFGPIAGALAAVATANLVFLSLMLLAQGDPPVIRNRVRTAFETGELDDRDYLLLDARRGWHQYNDCNVLQMLVNQGTSRLSNALAPNVYYADESWENQCRVLRALVVENSDPRHFSLLPYVRYWHGYNAVAAVGLGILELRDLRRAYVAAVWLAIGLLGAVAIRSTGRTRRVGLAIAFSAATVWAVPYFAPGLTQGVGDAFLLLSLAGVVAWRDSLVRPSVLVPLAAAFGSTVVFFEMLTGQLPTAVAWLAALVLAAGRDRKGSTGPAPPVLALWAALAFGFGALGTVAAKQIAAVVTVDSDAAGAFFVQLRFYMARVAVSSSEPSGFWLPVVRLVEEAGMLTFGNARAGQALLTLAAAAWLVALVRGWRRRQDDSAVDVLVLLVLGLVPAAWVLVLPQHTYIHAPFMVRILVVPVSLALVAPFWPLRLARG